MKKSYFSAWLVFLCSFVFVGVGTSAFANEEQFSIPSRGVQYFDIRVPENAKQIKAIVSGQSEMVNLALYAPGKDIPSSKNSTWSHLSNWKKPLMCSVNKPKSGVWRIKVEGAVHKGKVDKIKFVSGVLNVYVNGVLTNNDLPAQAAVASPSQPLAQEYRFTIASRGSKYYEVSVPENTKKIKALISEQSEMVNLALYAPGKSIPSSKSSTFSHLPNWQKPLECSVSKPKSGVWRVKVEGAVYKAKADKIKVVSGVLKISMDGATAHIEVLKHAFKGNPFNLTATFSVQVFGHDADLLKLFGVSSSSEMKQLKSIQVRSGDKVSLSTQFSRFETSYFELRLYDSKGDVVARKRLRAE